MRDSNTSAGIEPDGTFAWSRLTMSLGTWYPPNAHLGGLIHADMGGITYIYIYMKNAYSIAHSMSLDTGAI